MMKTTSITRPTRRTLLSALALWACSSLASLGSQDSAETGGAEEKDRAVKVEYLEIVTPKVEEACASLAELHGVEFSEPVAAFGNARTASLKGGGRIGVRAPMHADEEPVVRPYLRVKDIDAASKAAEAAGAEFMMAATEIPEQGKFAIYLHGGIQYGLWEL